MKKIIVISALIFGLSSCGGSQNIENKGILKDSNIEKNVIAEKEKDFVEVENKETNISVDKKIDDSIIEKEKINKVKHFDKYNLECKKFSTEEGKKHCWETKIESRLFYIFRGYEGDDIYKIKCSDVFSVEKWEKIPELSKKYIEKCEKVIAPHYKIYKEKLKLEKQDKAYKKNADNFVLSDCDKILEKKYSKEKKEVKKNLLNKCRIGYVLKSNKSCNILKNISEIDKCNIVKKNITEYKKIIEKQKDYEDFNNINYENFIKGNWVEK